MAYTAPYANSYFWAQQCFTGRKKHPAHRALATALGMDLGHPWLKFPAGTVEQRTCARTSLRPKRKQPEQAPLVQIPDSLPWALVTDFPRKRRSDGSYPT